MEEPGFWSGVWSDVKALIDPILIVIKGIFGIFIKLFEFIGDFLKGIGD